MPGDRSFKFKLFFNKKELEDPDGAILSQFIKELYVEKKS